jgi:hypothetical protein
VPVGVLNVPDELEKSIDADPGATPTGPENVAVPVGVLNVPDELEKSIDTDPVELTELLKTTLFFIVIKPLLISITP